MRAVVGPWRNLVARCIAEPAPFARHTSRGPAASVGPAQAPAPGGVVIRCAEARGELAAAVPVGAGVKARTEDIPGEAGRCAPVEVEVLRTREAEITPSCSRLYFLANPCRAKKDKS